MHCHVLSSGQGFYNDLWFIHVCLQVQQAVLAVLPLLKPVDDHLAPLWLTFIYQVLSYLPDGNDLFCKDPKSVAVQLDSIKLQDTGRSVASPKTSPIQVNGHSFVPAKAADAFSKGGSLGKTLLPLGSSNPGLGIPEKKATEELSAAFSEKLVKVVLELYQACPPATGATSLPDIVAAFGR